MFFLNLSNVGIVYDCANRFVDSWVSHAATQIPSHGGLYLVIRWVWVGTKKRNGLHNLTRLTVPTLWNLMFNPGLLHGMIYSST
jgi:hypothetical protein